MDAEGTGDDRGLAVLRRLVDQVSDTATWLVDAPPEIAALDGPSPVAARRRLLTVLRHRSAQLQLAGTVVLAVLLNSIGGKGLAGWAFGLGLDQSQAGLIAGVLVATIAAGIVAGVGGRIAPARLGGLLALVLLEAGQVAGGAHPTGLRGWLLTGIVAAVAATVVIGLGSAVGLQLHGDLSGLRRLLRRNRRAWLLVIGAAALALAGLSPAMIAVQEGPISQLYDYSVGPLVPLHDNFNASAPPLTAAVGPPSTDSGPPTAPPGTPGAPAPAVGAPGAVSSATSSSAGAPGAIRAASTVTHTSPGAPVSTPNAPATPAPPQGPPGSVTTQTVAGRAAIVYIPDAYTHQPDMRLPVLYVLHGYPGNADQWIGDGAQLPQVLDQLIAGGLLPPMIVVMPDGNGTAVSDTEWGNTAHGDRIEDWLVRSLVPAIDRRYRTLGWQYRGIAGFSAGGFGAANLALRHPNTFRWAASWSGYFSGRQDVFGPTTAANSPTLIAGNLASDQRMPLYIGIGSEDYEFAADNHQFSAELARVGWSAVKNDTVPGGHGWEAWRLEIVHSLRWLGATWGVNLASMQAAAGQPSPTPGPSPTASPTPAPTATPTPTPAPTAPPHGRSTPPPANPTPDPNAPQPPPQPPPGG